MAGCLNPFARTCFASPSTLTNPTGSFTFPGGVFTAVLEFPVPMDMGTAIIPGDFLFRTLNGLDENPVSLSWIDSTHLQVIGPGVFYWSDPLYLDYLKVTGLLKTDYGEAYDAWNDVVLTDLT